MIWLCPKKTKAAHSCLSLAAGRERARSCTLSGRSREPGLCLQQGVLAGQGDPTRCNLGLQGSGVQLSITETLSFPVLYYNDFLMPLVPSITA